MHLNVIDDLANMIFVGAYWVKDILWLRLLSIVGSLVVIPYYLLQTDPLWTPMMWRVVVAPRRLGTIRSQPRRRTSWRAASPLIPSRVAISA